MDDVLSLDMIMEADSIIKVIGVGGGGCNAVNYMYRQGIKDVSFLVSNTDNVALGRSSIPAKLQLGPGLGAGGDPTVAEKYADESRDRIREALNDGTKMLFLTATLGGGTGTGASPIIAEVSQEMGILTIAIVTIPFQFEGRKKIHKAFVGLAKLAEHVDAILVINNERLKEIYPDLDFINAFSKSDDVVCNAARSIAEIITVPGYINTDFQDVYNTLKDGNMAIMNVGQASGEKRISAAITNALSSPLVRTNDVHGAKRVLLQFYFSPEHAIVMKEIEEIEQFVQEMGDEVEVQWGTTIDPEMGEDVRVTIIATGYDITDIPSLSEEVGRLSVDESIDTNYQKPREAPKDDEKPTTLELNISAEPADMPASPKEKGKDIVIDGCEITFEEEPKDNQPQPAEPKREEEHKKSSLFGRVRKRF